MHHHCRQACWVFVFRGVGLWQVGSCQRVCCTHRNTLTGRMPPLHQQSGSQSGAPWLLCRDAGTQDRRLQAAGMLGGRTQVPANHLQLPALTGPAAMITCCRSCCWQVGKHWHSVQRDTQPTPRSTNCCPAHPGLALLPCCDTPGMMHPALDACTDLMAPRLCGF